jgi:GH25 family lysozyme M1 (1,4-beta-N-acetylmuramidase)
MQSNYDNKMGDHGKLKFTLLLLLNLLFSKSVNFDIRKKASIAILREVLIIDVSKWQGSINFFVMASRGIVNGVIPKASQGTVEDPKYHEHVAGMISANLPFGSYHFYDSRVEPKSQALKWWNTIKGSQGVLPHAADLEDNYGGPYHGPKYWRIFIEEFLRLSGYPDKRVIIYTAYYYWMSNVPSADRTFFKRFKLWLAWYTFFPSFVKIPPPWTENDLWGWQYGTTDPNGVPRGEYFGCSGSKEIDESNRPVTVDEHNAEYGIIGENVPPVLPPEEPPMTVQIISAGKVNVTSAIVRDAPDGIDTKLRVTKDVTVVIVGESVQAGTHKWVNLRYPVSGYVAEDLLREITVIASVDVPEGTPETLIDSVHLTGELTVTIPGQADQVFSIVNMPLIKGKLVV